MGDCFALCQLRNGESRRALTAVSIETKRHQNAKVSLCSGAMQRKGYQFLARSEGSGACPTRTNALSET